MHLWPSDWNTWIQWFGCVREYFWQCRVCYLHSVALQLSFEGKKWQIYLCCSFWLLAFFTRRGHICKKPQIRCVTATLQIKTAPFRSTWWPFSFPENRSNRTSRSPSGCCWIDMQPEKQSQWCKKNKKSSILMKEEATNPLFPTSVDYISVAQPRCSFLPSSPTGLWAPGCWLSSMLWTVGPTLACGWWRSFLLGKSAAGHFKVSQEALQDLVMPPGVSTLRSSTTDGRFIAIEACCSDDEANRACSPFPKLSNNAFSSPHSANTLYFCVRLSCMALCKCQPVFSSSSLPPRRR